MTVVFIDSHYWSVHGILGIVAVLRAAWWQVVGEAQGNVQVESRCQLKTDAVARYLTKYISKSLGDGRDKGQHRYRRSQNLKVPVEKIVFHGSRGAEREQALKGMDRRGKWSLDHFRVAQRGRSPVRVSNFSVRGKTRVNSRSFV